MIEERKAIDRDAATARFDEIAKERYATDVFD
jgi:hypothetical protein